MTILDWAAIGMLAALVLQIAAVIFVIWRVEREKRQPAVRDPLFEAICAEAMQAIREDFRGHARPAP